MVSEATWVTSPMATWIFLLCLRNFLLEVLTITAISGRMATITRVRRQFIHSSERNRKTTVMPSRITTLIASVTAPVFNVYESLLVEPPGDQSITVTLLDKPAIQATGKVREVTPAVSAQSGTVPRIPQ